MEEEKKIILVTAEECPFCKLTKSFLDKKGIKYKEMTPEEYEKEYKEEVLGVPITCNKDKCVAGFNPKELENIV